MVRRVKQKVRKILMSSASGGAPISDAPTIPNPILSTSKYKAYVQAVDRALKTFENPNEWADLISALQKLAKVFQSNAKYGEIPKPVLVAKRLSQCLHPALPMGVHVKALETYRQVFDILGPELPKYLYLFTVGLFPLMDHCGIKVKSDLFTIFEQYLVPMGANLRPALPGFLAGLLLGLEEGTEFYERSLKVLDRVSDGVGACSFFACLWQAVLGSPSVRLPAMVYVNAKFEKSKSLDDQIYIVGDHVNQMVSALCATAEDTGSPLVQRHLLDFLCAAFPLDSTNLTKDDFVQLLRRCLFVVLRRDMSLNRRLFTWFMNPTGSTVAVSGFPVGDDRVDASFFESNVLPMAVDALDSYLNLDIIEIPHSNQNTWAHGWGEKKEGDQQQFSEVRVCRLLTYLQDRADIGRPLMENVLPLLLTRCANIHPDLQTQFSRKGPDEKFLDRKKCLSLNLSPYNSDIKNVIDGCEKETTTRRVDEITKTLNVLLSSLEMGFIWDFLGDRCEQYMQEDNPSSDRLTQFAKVVLFCLRVCSLEDVALKRRCLSKLLCRILNSMRTRIGVIAHDSALHILHVCSQLLDQISQPVAVNVEGEVSDASSPSSPSKPKSPDGFGDQDLFESCLNECLLLLASVCEMYHKNRISSLLPVFFSTSDLVSKFFEVPVYCLSLDSGSTDHLPPWIDQLLSVLDPKQWLSDISAGKCEDLAARASALDLLCALYLNSSSILAQHEAITTRTSSDTSKDEQTTSAPTTVLLKPILLQKHLDEMEKNNVFELCAAAAWIGMGDDSCAMEHQRLARLLAVLHSRKTSEASSDVENIIITALTNTNQMVSTNAASTFYRFWSLSRSCEEQMNGMVLKPFNRAVMLLLGVLADESVSRSRTEIKSVAAAWFIDCAKHNDLPRIVQMLSTMLMNPVTARISIQYLHKDYRLTRDQLNLLPPSASAVTLITADQKQRLYHVDGATLDSTLQGELRNRLLLNSHEDNLPSDNTSTSKCAVLSGDVPNFDDDTDSLDTVSLSLEGVDPGVVEVLQNLIDSVVEEEENESETARKFEQALDNISVGKSVVFRAGAGTDLSSEDAMGVEKSERSVAKEKSMDNISRVKRGHRRQDSLQESIFSMTEKELKAFDAADLLRPSNEAEGEAPFHELHVHMLLYGESGKVVDLGRAETAFRILTALLNPRVAPISNRLLLSCLVSSGTASQGGEMSGLCGSLVDLMAKHVRAILGQHFWGVNMDEEGGKHRHLTLLELLITISLHFLRSYFLNSPVCPVTEADLFISWKCKIAALDFLSELVGELSSMLCEQQSRAFVLFVQSILTRAKLQKCVLHLLFSLVHDARSSNEEDKRLPLSVSISEFNEGAGSDVGDRLSGLLAAYQRSLLSLTAQTIRIESEIKNGCNTFNDLKASGVLLNRLSVSQQLYNSAAHRGTVREPHPSLVELRAFLLIVLNALKRQPSRHEVWLQFVVQILPWMERSLAAIVVRVVEQLCKNIAKAMIGSYAVVSKDIFSIESSVTDCGDEVYPSNFVIMALETLTTLVHFCVVDSGSCSPCTVQPPAVSNSQTSFSSSSGGATSMMGQAISVIPGTKGATELFSNLVKVFSFNDSHSPNGVALSKLEAVRNGGTGWRQARNDMLTSLPHALTTICDLWTVIRSGETPRFPVGTPQQLRRLVLDLLAPIAQHQQQAFLQSLSLVWLTRSVSGKSSDDQSALVYTPSQLDIANLLLSLKVIPVEDLISAVCETLKESGAKASKLGPQTDKGAFPTEAPLLELVHGCVRALPPVQLRQCWPSLQILFSDAPFANLPPRAIFLLFIILCDFVRVAGASYIVEDKTMCRAVHDAVQRLTEAVNVVVSWQLETTTWLKRTLVVRQDQNIGSRSQDASPSVESSTPLNTPMSSLTLSEQGSNRGSALSLLNRPPSIDTSNSIPSIPEKKSSSNLRGSVKDTNNNKRDPAHSTQALFILAENLAELVDSVCKSDDKDRLLPTLHAVWNNVVPYLRAKNARNARFFLASSQLLASMSSFNYMRPVWKKITLELLLESSFFKMDIKSLRQWLIVTDHLMTHDKTSFKDLLKSIAYTPNASFSIMTSKEQEYEARAQALKRLAFVVLGSEMDQYQAQMNDIQERLSENLRVSQSPTIRSAVFLCIRVLLIRLRPPSLVGIWPIMITELVHVLLQMEQQLNGDRIGMEDLACARDDAWMQLYLAACKLLETLCTLPAGYLAQFQMCHWAFVNSVATDKTDMFVPFAGRINKLLKTKYGKISDTERETQAISLCGMKLLTSFDELRPFFSALATQNSNVSTGYQEATPGSTYLTGSLSFKNAISRLENALYVDFAEHWQL